MLAVILGFAVIVGLAKRLRKLLVQEKQEGFTENTFNSNYYILIFFTKFTNTYYPLDNKDNIEWWNDKNEFIFDELLDTAFDSNSTNSDNFYNKLYNYDENSKKYKKDKDGSLYGVIIVNFFNEIGNEPISMCFDIIKKEGNINIIGIRDSLTVESDPNFFKNFYNTVDNRCTFEDDEPDKLLRECNRDDLVKFYSIINRTCEYTKKYRQNIGRIPKIISESYDPSLNFGFLRFDHMIDWVNYYNDRLYESHLSNSNSDDSLFGGTDAQGETVPQGETGPQSKEEDKSASKCSAISTAHERSNDFLEQFYGFMNDDVDSYGKFRELLFGDKSKLENKGILKKKHYNIIRELQFDNMGFVNKVFKKIEIIKDNTPVIREGNFIPILNTKPLKDIILKEYGILEKAIKNNTLKYMYVNDKDRTVIFFLLVIGYLNIYHLIQDEKNNKDPTKTDTIIEDTDAIKDYYKTKHLVYKDTGKKYLTLSNDKGKTIDGKTIDDKITELKAKLDDANFKDKSIKYIVNYFKGLDNKDSPLNQKELDILIKNVGDKPIHVINMVLESDAVQERRNISANLKRILEESIYKPFFENTDINTMRAFFNNMVKILAEEDIVKKLDVSGLSKSECDKCMNDFLFDLLKTVKQQGENTPTSEDNAGQEQDTASETDTNKITLTTTNNNIKDKLQNYQIKILVSIMEVGFKFFLLELAHHIANSQDTNPVGDVESKSRTARSSYELRDSLDLGHFYY